MKMTFKTVTLLLLLMSSLHAAITITPDTREVNLLRQSELYYDLTAKATIDMLVKDPNKFKPLDVEYLNFGHQKKYPAWIKFTLTNPTSKVIHRVINIDNLKIQSIELYHVKNDKVLQKEDTGLRYRKSFNGILMPNFSISLPPNSTQTYFIKLHSPSECLFFKLKLSSEDLFLKQDITRHVIWALFFATLLSIVIYNLFLFIFTRDSIYFYYLLYLCAILTADRFSYIAVLHMLAYDDSSLFLTYKAVLQVYHANFVALSMVLFIRSFLKTKQYPKIDLVMKMLIALPIILSMIQVTGLLQTKDLSSLYFLLIFFYFFVGLYALYKKNSQAMYFVIGWGIALLGWLSILLQCLDIWNVMYMFYYIFEVLVVIEVFLFSFAISSRINTLNKVKNTLSASLLQQKKSENIRLEKVVKERTESLNLELEKNSLLLQELHHRVKNNMQFITALYALKLNNSDRSTQAKLSDLERKVSAIGEVHDMLYNQKNLQHIDAGDYFDKIVQKIKESFEIEKIKFYFDIHAKLETDEAINCGLIVNELVTNAIKYAFPKNEGEIRIELNEDEHFKYLIVKDNGIGIPDDHQNGFGQTMLEALAINQLNGQLSVNRSNGTQIKITFPKK